MKGDSKMRFVELYIAALIMWSMDYIMGRILFENNSKPDYKKVIPIILIVSTLVTLINVANTEIFGGIMKIILIYILIYHFYMIIFNKTSSQILVGSLILYLTLFISETITAIFISFIFYLLDNQSMEILKNTILINIIITTISYLIIKKNEKKLIILIKNSNSNAKSGIFMTILILVTISLLVFKIPLSNWSLNIEFMLTMLFLLCFILIGFYMLKQKADIQKTTAMYQQLVDYSDITNNLLEEYRVISHEQKNHLLIIRGMLDETNKELVDYVDNLLDKQVGFKYEWIGDLNHLPLSGLKGLINYKLMEMEALGIVTDVSISKEVLKTKLNKLSTKQKDNLYSIMGVYLDNAIQAAKDSKKKEISLEVYKEKRNVIVVLANTYKGKIEINKIDNYGYSTKGKNHGVGLHIVKRIIEEETIFTQSRDLFDEYYIQKLVINLYQIKGK